MDCAQIEYHQSANDRLDDAMLLLDWQRSLPIPIPTLKSDLQANHPEMDQEMMMAASLLIKASSGPPMSISEFSTAPAKARSVKSEQASGKICAFCAATSTPMWRNGPPEYPQLCNRCGVKHMRGRLLPDPRNQL